MPTAQKINLPAGYGTVSSTIEWATVREQLESAKQYWISLNRSSGSPHVIPIDGVWLDDAWHYGGSPDTLHMRLVADDPHITMHLPDPWQVVIVEGIVRKTAPAQELAQRLARVSNEKYPDYGITYGASSFTSVMMLQPQHALAWSSFPSDCTRFTF